MGSVSRVTCTATVQLAKDVQEQPPAPIGTYAEQQIRLQRAELQERKPSDTKPQRHGARHTREVSKAYRAQLETPTQNSELSSVGAYLTSGGGWGDNVEVAKANFTSSTKNPLCAEEDDITTDEDDSWADWDESSDEDDSSYAEAVQRSSDESTMVPTTAIGKCYHAQHRTRNTRKPTVRTTSSSWPRRTCSPVHSPS